MKLWDKNSSTEERILAFTTGMDPVFDKQLAPYDVAGSMAHVIMLSEVGLVAAEEAAEMVGELSRIYDLAAGGELTIGEGVEDIHSQVEMMLTRSLGDAGKKIHTGRSRNDQVMVDTKLFLREELGNIVTGARKLAGTLLSRAEEHEKVPMPGYTHMQVAMPSSFGLWFGAYAEALADDLGFLHGVYRVVDQNPLGSAAGFGSSFPVDRELTTRLLGFSGPHVNSVNAQLNRGKTEWYVATGIAALAATVARMAMDAVLFLGQNFGFFNLPENLTTGSSIMPHKKNPDVLELIRARCNRMVQLPQQVAAVTTNLISGYHRDFQILKEVLHPAISDLKNCLYMAEFVMSKIIVNKEIMNDETYRYLYTVEEVNRKVMEGMPFRDAYREVAEDIEKDRYRPGREHSYTHLGSVGNPGNREVKAKLESVIKAFGFVEIRNIVNTMRTYFNNP